MIPVIQDPRCILVQGDSAEVLRSLPDESVDAVICDPPAGIGFMGKEWDKDKGGRDAWVAWLTGIMRECLRVLKPGGHALVWALPRTSGWTSWALEDAGFDVYDRISHFFGTGFPKSLNIAKAIDDKLGATRPVVGMKVRPDGTSRPNKGNWTPGTAVTFAQDEWTRTKMATGGNDVTAPGSPEAAEWEGWGTALKPACEDWWLAQKPFKGTYATNVLEHGTGALNIDGCRIAGDNPSVDRRQSKAPGESVGASGWVTPARPASYSEPHPGESLGRWPAHVVLSHLEECEEVGTAPDSVERTPRPGSHFYDVGAENNAERKPVPPAEILVPVFRCAPGCPVAELDAQGPAGCKDSRKIPAEKRGKRTGNFFNTGADRGSDVPNGPLYADEGGPSRFFFTPGPTLCRSCAFVRGVVLSSLRNASAGDSAASHAQVQPTTSPRGPGCSVPTDGCQAPSTSATPSASGRPGESSTPPIQSTEGKCSPESPPTSMSPTSPVNRAGLSEPTATTRITDDPSTCDSCAARVISEIMLRTSEPGDPDSASARFKYCSKPSPKERDYGCAHLLAKSGGEATDRADGSAGLKSPRAGAGRGGNRKNTHPTVKSVALMRWLVRLITPPGGVVLDPFAGSGTTGIAALHEGHSFIGIELGGEAGEYIPIVEARLRAALRGDPLP